MQHSPKYNTIHESTAARVYRKCLAEHYGVPAIDSRFSQLNTAINYICPSVCCGVCEMKQKNTLSFSGNKVVCDAFFFFVVSSIYL